MMISSANFFFCKIDLGLKGKYLKRTLDLMQRSAFTGTNHYEEVELKSLAYGAEILQQLCSFVKAKTGYTCSGTALSCNDIPLFSKYQYLMYNYLKVSCSTCWLSVNKNSLKVM